ncbi:MAG: hypothetical protein A2V66_06040 [Ignavibacteria bacterium RBG_13_36_8]|nr:MAG: hypothetical protein A2V66_06040 [Ignavibacteria bacterium RBG_13_36_8]
MNEIKQTFVNRYESINTDIKNLTGLVSTIDDIAKSDFEKLKSMAKLPTLSTEGIAQILVGNEMYKRALGYLGWVDLARTNIKKYSPEPEYEKPARFEGQDIPFPVERGYPKLWIKNVKISGRTDKEKQNDFFSASGKAQNITNNQTLTGVPLSFSLDGTYSDRRDLQLSGLIDRTKDIPFDEYAAKLSGVALSSFELGNKNFLPSKITDGRMNTAVKISVPGNGFDSRIDIDLSNFTLQFETEPRSIVERLAREVLEGIKGFNVKMRLWNTGGTFKVALSTDLDNLLSQRLMNVIGAEIANLQNQLRDKFNAIVNQKRAEFDQFYNAQKEKVENKLGTFQTLLNDKLSIVDTKKEELQDRLDKVQKGLGNQLLDLLKKGG